MNKHTNIRLLDYNHRYQKLRYFVGLPARWRCAGTTPIYSWRISWSVGLTSITRPSATSVSLPSLASTTSSPSAASGCDRCLSVSVGRLRRSRIMLVFPVTRPTLLDVADLSSSYDTIRKTYKLCVTLYKYKHKET